MKLIEKGARGWPILLASVVLTAPGQARAQMTPAPTSPSGRAPLTVTVYATNPAKPRKPVAASPRIASDATLARFDQEPNSPGSAADPNPGLMSRSPLHTPEVSPEVGSGTPPADLSGDFFLRPTPPNDSHAAPNLPYGSPAPQAIPLDSGQGFAGMSFGSSQQMPMGPPFGPYPGQNACPVPFMNQSVSMPTSKSTSRIRVKGPGPVGAGLARFGERLTHLGRTRIESVQETELEAPLTQSTNGISTFSAVAARPTVSFQNSPSGQPDQSPWLSSQPSPQSDQRVHKHHWWK